MTSLPARQPDALGERFWPNVERHGPDECWPWLGELNRKGHGRFVNEDGSRIPAARVSWLIHNEGRAWPEGALACHRCDNPPCVNPAHIWPGTPRENVQDMFDKGRMKGCAEHNRTKTHCVRGHELSGDNVYLKEGKWRICRICRRDFTRRWRAERRALAGRFALLDFVRESNRIEGILRPPTRREMAAHVAFLAEPVPTIRALERFVSFVQPRAKLRRQLGMNVRVGNHLPPLGGPAIEPVLAAILRISDPYAAHHAYETLHPFMDGNGRSGRVLWLHLIGGIERAPLGFLHHWYYRSLSDGRSEADRERIEELEALLRRALSHPVVSEKLCECGSADCLTANIRTALQGTKP